MNPRPVDCASANRLQRGVESIKKNKTVFTKKCRVYDISIFKLVGHVLMYKSQHKQ